MNAPKQKSAKIFKFALKAVLVMVVFFYVGKYASIYYVNSHSEIAKAAKKGELVNILFLGVDAREREEKSRSDTIILASIDMEKKKVALLSIPRDTHIRDARGRALRINAVNFIDGAQGVCESIGQMLDINIPYYVLTNFEGFVNIIDILGGVELDVEMKMRHPDPVNPKLAINLDKGLQRLDGDKALQYVRFRGDPTADIGRTQRQQKFLQALMEQTLQGSTITKLPDLISELLENVKTNLSLQDMVFVGSVVANFEPGSMISQTLPGYSFSDSQTGASYWKVDREIASHIVQDMLEGKTYNTYQKKAN